MTKIKKYVEQIKEELDGAKGYAENYVEQKVKGNTPMANKYKEMANDELKHAGYLHELVTTEIAEIQKTIKPPENMVQRWEAAHVEYVDNAAWVKQMLTL